MSSDEVAKIVEEIAPKHVRGKELNRTIVNRGSNQFTIIEYENAVITRSTQGDREMRATVSFKRDVCAKDGVSGQSTSPVIRFTGRYPQTVAPRSRPR